MSNSHKTVLQLALFFLIATVCILGRDTAAFEAYANFSWLLIFVGIPVFSIFFLVVLFRMWRHKISISRAVGRETRIILFFIPVLLPFFLGLYFLKHDFNTAIAAARLLIPKIEQFKNLTGSYPLTFSEIADIRRLPKLLREENIYHSDGQTYTLTITQSCPGTLCIDQYRYTSQCGEDMVCQSNDVIKRLKKQ